MSNTCVPRRECATAISEKLGYTVLASGRTGPRLLERRVGTRLEYYLLFHVDQSTLPFRVGFPILAANLLEIGRLQAGLAEVRGSRTGVLPPLQLKPRTTYRVAGPNGGAVDASTSESGVLNGVSALADRPAMLPSSRAGRRAASVPPLYWPIDSAETPFNTPGFARRRIDGTTVWTNHAVAGRACRLRCNSNHSHNLPRGWSKRWCWADASASESGVLNGVSALSIGQYRVTDGGTEAARVGVSLLDSMETSLAAVKQLRFKENQEVAATNDRIDSDRPLWPSFALVGFGVLLVEWWYFQRRPGGWPST